MSNKTTKASVILPIYNADKYLTEAIESILNQTWKDFEVLLLNDGSTDKSEAIIDEFCKKDARCKKFSWPNKGLVPTLNQGIKEARSDLLIRMDADDICEPTRFEKQFDFLKNNPDHVAVGSNVMLIDDVGLPIISIAQFFDHHQLDRHNLLGLGSALVHPSVMMRKKAVIDVGGYDARYKHAEDLDLFLKLAEIGKLANINESLLYYRQHLTSIGYTKRFDQHNACIKAVKSAQSRRGIKHELHQKPPSSSDIQNINQIYRKWAWWSLKGKNRKTARKYAIKAFISAPYKLENLKVLFFALKGD